MRRSLFFLALAFSASVQAITPNEWRFSQTVDVPAAGLIRLNLSSETVDAARPDVEDLRLLDSAGNEVPYLVDRPMPRQESALRPKELRTELAAGSTQITLTTGTKAPLKGVTFEAPPGAEFIKGVRVEGSPDGKGWRELAAGQPIFRVKGGAQNLHVIFPQGAWDFLRLTSDDSRATAVPFTGVLVNLAETKAPAEPADVKIKARDESLGVTRLSLDLGASNLIIASLRIEASDPLFTRSVTLAVPELANDSVHEQTVFAGSIYRLDLNGKTESRLEIPIDSQIRGRELIVFVQNGDSAPLTIDAVKAEKRMTRLVFLAREPGRYQLLSGNSQCSAPRYDLSAMADQLKTAPATELRPGSLVANAGYAAADTLAEVSLTGAPIDVSGWKNRRQIQAAKSGAQQLELDPDVLAHATADQRDLRIVSEDRQLPFLLERTSISRPLLLKATAIKDPKRPAFSRWSMKLPQAGVPITQVSCLASTPLFQREMRLLEDVVDERGDAYPHDLGRASWKQLPNETVREFVIRLDTSPKSDTLFLETDNGDNPAIELRDFRAYYPVTRLIFKTAPNASQPLWIYYGNADAPAPRYDVSLIAGQLLRAERTEATLGRQENTGSTTQRLTETLTGSSRYIFWGVLGLVVVGLLVVISRLLPKPQ